MVSSACWYMRMKTHVLFHTLGQRIHARCQIHAPKREGKIKFHLSVQLHCASDVNAVVAIPLKPVNVVVAESSSASAQQHSASAR
jgi:hypothetical protein